MFGHRVIDGVISSDIAKKWLEMGGNVVKSIMTQEWIIPKSPTCNISKNLRSIALWQFLFTILPPSQYKDIYTSMAISQDFSTLTRSLTSILRLLLSRTVRVFHDPRGLSLPHATIALTSIQQGFVVATFHLKRCHVPGLGLGSVGVLQHCTFVNQSHGSGKRALYIYIYTHIS